MGLHRIRLAAPWELSHRTAASPETAPASSTCKLPLALNELVVTESSSDSEMILLSRKFHCPTGINDTTRVYIEIELDEFVPTELLKAVVLNDDALSISNRIADTSHLLHVDVSGRLRAFNMLQLQFPVAVSHTSGRLMSVTLMIEE